MTPLALRLCRFGSFVTEQEFRFPKEAGLYFMQGINKAEPRLEANGSGKSTIWNALTWVIHGKTAKGLKAGDAANWEEGEGCWVEFDYKKSDGRSLRRIRRSWKPNQWELWDPLFNQRIADLTKDESNELLADLQLDFAPWLNCILMAQGMPMFLDLDGPKKAELFSDVMGLDTWLTFSERASQKAKDQDAISRRLERRIAELEGKLEGLDASSVDEDLERWEGERDKRYEKLVQAHESGCQGLHHASDDAKDAERREEEAREAYQKALGASDEMRACEDTQQELLSAAKADEAVAKDRFLQINQQTSLEAGNCPTCGQVVTRANRAQRAEERSQALHRAEREWKALQKATDSEQEALASVREKADRHAAACKKALIAYDDAKKRTKDLRRALEMLERDLDKMEADAQKITDEVNPYQRLKDEAKSQAREIRGELRSSRKQLEDSYEKHSMYGYWVRGFKEVRLQEIGTALCELEVEVNSEITALGLLDWELRFELDREGKGGKLQRGFSVSVRSPHNARAVPWEAWSGGEGQRLRLAANMGLANLIRSRSGTGLNLEVWDEPTQWMSQGGVTDLLKVLAERAKREQRQIWIVDHRSLGFGGFAGTATVEKTSKGSRLIQGETK